MSKTILVAGGAGFIGSHLCRKLLNEKNHVYCIDNLSTGQKSNIENLFKLKNFKFIKSDIINKTFIRKLKTIKIDQIYHLASPASLQAIYKDPVKTALVNSIGTNNLLDLARKHNAKILYASSSETYGDPREHPQKETYWGNVNPVGARSSYDESKRFGEALCMAYFKKYKVNIKIVRLFNTYGPNYNKNDSRIIPSFINQALQNQSITVHGNGLQTRSFCYVEDTVNGIYKVMNSDKELIFNIGNPTEIQVLKIAEIIIKLTKSNSKIVYTPRPEDDPSLRKPDITKAKKILKWKPEIKLKEGLLKTIEYFKSYEK